jgi:hypothetical protein
MLTWTTPFPDKPDYHAELGASDPAGINAAIVEAWSKFLDGLDAVPPQRWSIVLAYLVAETGSVSLYPTTRANPGSGMDDLSVTLRIYDWAAEYEEFSDALYEGVDPEEPEAAPSSAAEASFERKYKAFLKKMAKALKDALTDPALAPRSAALKKREHFAIDYVDQGETVHTANLVYLWGERPSKAFPASTPRELFTGLMNKGSIWPSTVLKFDGDNVIEATFFGANFNDKYVDILESVPNVATLCKDLAVLKIESTRITPAGINRLKALFPSCKFEINARGK